MLTTNCISIDKNRRNISILATEPVEKNFIELLTELGIEHKIKDNTKLNKILNSEQNP